MLMTLSYDHPLLLLLLLLLSLKSSSRLPRLRGRLHAPTLLPALLSRTQDPGRRVPGGGVMSSGLGTHADMCWGITCS